MFSEFQEFCEKNGIHYRRINPLWPQTNAEVERQIRNLNEVIIIAYAQGANLEEELNNFLTAYCTTHSTTGKAPDEMLYKKPL